MMMTKTKQTKMMNKNKEINTNPLSLILFRILEVIFIVVMGTGLGIFAYTQVNTLIYQIGFIFVVSFCVIMIIKTLFNKNI